MNGPLPAVDRVIRLYPDGGGEAPCRRVHSLPGTKLASDFSLLWAYFVGQYSWSHRRAAVGLRAWLALVARLGTWKTHGEGRDGRVIPRPPAADRSVVRRRVADARSSGRAAIVAPCGGIGATACLVATTRAVPDSAATTPARGGASERKRAAIPRAAARIFGDSYPPAVTRCTRKSSSAPTVRSEHWPAQPKTGTKTKTLHRSPPG